MKINSNANGSLFLWDLNLERGKFEDSKLITKCLDTKGLEKTRCLFILFYFVISFLMLKLSFISTVLFSYEGGFNFFLII